ncbi:hypothetical protein [Desulforegula conservatrix]|uniref:hypothetical protein n=1 Tax=Desulforegula conservatrix TaxID=153026 RepID=UPI000416F65C|nr:hypothetical protein [Desulforegula conservatrix]
MCPELINGIKSKLPSPILKGLERIPPKDQPKIFMDTCGHLSGIPDELDEDLVTEIERAIRYLDAKIRLVRMMLSTQIRNDGWDVVETECIIMDIYKKFGSGEFYKAYEEFYQGKTLEELGIII